MLSLIIPVYNVADYISSCLDAICEQTFRNIEIIAVDGGSDDETPEKLEKRHIDEPRLTIVREAHIGPGQARNVGIDRATGDYVWFIDGDDLIAPECLVPISNRLTTIKPDVLLINHKILSPAGDLTPSHDSPLLCREYPDSFTIEEQPALIDLRMVSWNKIVRREFLTRTGVRFLSEFPHEDVPVSCGLLLAASRLSVLRTVCYHQFERPGSIMNAGNRRRHFAIFGAWQPILRRALDDAAAHNGNVTKQVYHTLFERAIWHCSTIFDTGGFGIGRFGADGYVARADRKEFFTSTWKMYADYVPDDFRPPDGFRGVKFWLIARNWYTAYSILDPLNHMRMAVVRRTRRRHYQSG